MIAVPAFNGYVERAQEEVCNNNRIELKIMYDIDAIMKNSENNDDKEFLRELVEQQIHIIE